MGGISWARVLLGGFGSEVGVVLSLIASIGMYRWVVAPGLPADDYRGIGERAGYYVAPPAGFVTTLLMAMWAARGSESTAVVTGVLVGVVSVIITIPFFVSAKPEHRLMYGIAFALRLAAGSIGGLLAQRL